MDIPTALTIIGIATVAAVWHTYLFSQTDDDEDSD